MRMNSMSAACGVAFLVLSTAPPAWAGERDGATCQTQRVVVTDDAVPVLAHPRWGAPRVGTMSAGERHGCIAVEMGDAHDRCGAEDSRVWMIIAAGERRVYVPSHCVADLHA